MIGCTEWLFFHMWRPNPSSKLSCPGVKLPNTVIYRQGQPHVWYSTGPSGITRKGKDYISNETVLSIFTNKQNAQSVTLVLRSVTHQKTSMNCEQLLYEYCDASALCKLIISRDRAPNMILQEFISPLGNHNYTVRTEWTPSLCVLTKRTNNHHLCHKRIPIERRIATFEGSYLDSKENVISPIVSRDIELICENIYKHVRLVTSGCIDIRKMILFFKVDEQGTVNLLFCNELRVQEMGKSTSRAKIQGPCMHSLFSGPRNHPDQGIYEEKDLESFNLKEELKIDQRTNCINCQQTLQEKYLIQMRHVIGSIDEGFLKNQDTKVSEAFQKLKQTIHDAKPESYHSCHFQNIEQEVRWLCQQLDLEQNTVLFREMEQIPSLVIKIFGRMTQKRYESIKRKEEYLNLEVPVCEKCYTHLTEYIVKPRKNNPQYYQEKAITNWRSHISTHFKKLLEPQSVQKLLSTGATNSKHRSKLQTAKTHSSNFSVKRTATSSSKVRALFNRQTVRISTPKQSRIIRVSAEQQDSRDKIRSQTPELRVRIKKQPNLEQIYSHKKKASRFNQSTDASEHDVALETVSKLREWSHLLQEK